MRPAVVEAVARPTTRPAAPRLPAPQYIEAEDTGAEPFDAAEVDAEARQ
jgi:hypothetical protein